MAPPRHSGVCRGSARKGGGGGRARARTPGARTPCPPPSTHTPPRPPPTHPMHPPHADYRDHLPTPLKTVYEAYQPVVENGRWTAGLNEMWCGRVGAWRVAGGGPRARSGARPLPPPGAPSCRSHPPTTHRHPTPPPSQVPQAKGRQAGGAHPVLGLVQVEPAALAGRVLWAVSELCSSPMRWVARMRGAAGGIVVYKGGWDRALKAPLSTTRHPSRALPTPHRPAPLLSHPRRCQDLRAVLLDRPAPDALGARRVRCQPGCARAPFLKEFVLLTHLHGGKQPPPPPPPLQASGRLPPAPVRALASPSHPHSPTHAPPRALRHTHRPRVHAASAQHWAPRLQVGHQGAV